MMVVKTGKLEVYVRRVSCYQYNQTVIFRDKVLLKDRQERGKIVNISFDEQSDSFLYDIKTFSCTYGGIHETLIREPI